MSGVDVIPVILTHLMLVIAVVIVVLVEAACSRPVAGVPNKRSSESRELEANLKDDAYKNEKTREKRGIG
jgi:outer membrane murein-binding lipoprotein Lpp